ncbi:MAG: hypothetical protein M1365_01280 [Actinobacteria bacterium]|nr:hypothetical protein [Actinomycetota bacterium]
MANKNSGTGLKRKVSHKMFFSVLSIAIVLAAIPLTVRFSQMEQNTQQEAAAKKLCPDKYGNTYGNCYDVTKYNCSTGFQTRQCYGGQNVQCCNGKVTVKKKKNCSDNNGTCIDINKYDCTISMNNLCPGGSNIKCCVGNYFRK